MHFTAELRSSDVVAAAGAPATETPPPARSPIGHVVEFVIRRRVPISIVVFGGLIVEDLVSGVVPRDILDLSDVKAMLGLCAVLAGLALRTWAAGFLVKDAELTTTGPYSLLRNPLYLGSFLMVGGFCLLLDDPENIWILPPALLLIYWPKLRREEHDLAVRFPETWPRYCARTSRFLPRLGHRPQLSGWMFSQWLQSCEYNAVLACTAALAGLHALRLIRLS